MEIFRWRGVNCALCKTQLDKEHALWCKKLVGHRQRIESLTGFKAEEILTDPSNLNRCGIQNRENLQRSVADEISRMIASAEGGAVYRVTMLTPLIPRYEVNRCRYI